MNILQRSSSSRLMILMGFLPLTTAFSVLKYYKAKGTFHLLGGEIACVIKAQVIILSKWCYKMLKMALKKTVKNSNLLNCFYKNCQVILVNTL